MIALLGIFGLSFIWDWYIPLWEWILAVSFINFYTIIAFKNPYYDSVAPIHEPEPEPEDDSPTDTLSSVMV